ncbi:hypothetical protein HPB47_003653 [Ixodes persulcatus]|uniref:Uncharacterized protein n=1 Tax=Ixodes persulcatus TaxID=34615 RepID=A0AC60PHY0_IXOPE|nr:hypothetical protein HPB47_003653 [Ixodes persulcatus]
MPGTPGICSITESSLLLLPGPVVIAVVDVVNPEPRLPPPASCVRGTSRDVNGSEDRRRGDSDAEGPRPPHPSGAVLSRKPRYDDSFETTLQARSRGVESVRYTPTSCPTAGKVGWSRGGLFRKGAKGSLGNILSPAGPAADCHRCDEAPQASAVRARRLRLSERAR